MLKQSLKAVGRPIWNRLRFRVNAEMDRRTASYQDIQQRQAQEIAVLRDQHEDVRAQLSAMQKSFAAAEQTIDELRRFAEGLPERFEKRTAEIFEQRIFLPGEPERDRSEPFMQHSTCSTSDLLHPRYYEICREIDYPPKFHRKLWEWVFIIHHLEQSGMLAQGRRGLGFGIGLERLPALFAKRGCTIVATDAPPEIGASGWSNTGQHASALDDLRHPPIVSNEIFDQRVTHRFCDMNAITDDLNGFDFTWSSCCFEHLGDLEAGMQFVINSVEKTLKPGGIAVHTTEFNLSSNEDTIESGPTVIYRRRDIEELVRRLRDRGHEVQPFIPAPQAHALDFHVDIPPYSNIPHLKLKLWQYAATSVGLIVKRGA
jgi:SAM-dependent methyltransferase